MDYRLDAKDLLRRVPELRVSARIKADELREINTQLTGTPGLSTKPMRGGGTQQEDRIDRLVSEKDIVTSRLREIRRELRKYYTAWSVLDEKEKMVLEAWYVNRRSCPADYVAATAPCDRVTAYRWHDAALTRFTRALHGIVVT